MTMSNFKKYLEFAIKTKEELIEKLKSYQPSEIADIVINEEKIRLQELKDIRKVVSI